MYGDWERDPEQWVPEVLENKLELQREIEEKTREYLEEGGQIELVGQTGLETISRAEIREKYGVTEEWITRSIEQKKFPIAVTFTNKRINQMKRRTKGGKDGDKYLLREVDIFFKNELWRLDGYERIFRISKRR